MFYLMSTVLLYGIHHGGYVNTVHVTFPSKAYTYYSLNSPKKKRNVVTPRILVIITQVTSCMLSRIV